MPGAASQGVDMANVLHFTSYNMHAVNTRVAEVAPPMGDAPRLLRLWLPCSLLTRASSAWPLAASFSKQ